jgi:DNA invertase Pin-like site-specific DNA recombinase
MTTYAYARVSTDGQDLTSQVQELTVAGAAKVYEEWVSGARSDRPVLKKLIRRLRPGDLVLVTRLDRLARSTRDLLNVLHTIAQAGARFRSLKDPWCDTTTPHGELMVTMLAGIATFERHLIAARTSEGRARARARGVHMGRPRKLNAYQRAEALRRREAGESLSDIARSYGVSHPTIGRL